MILPPCYGKAVLDDLTLHLDNAVGVEADAREKAAMMAVDQAAKIGHNISAPAERLHYTRELDEGKGIIVHTAVFAGLNIDAQLMGGEMDGGTAVAIMANGWLPPETLVIPGLSGRRLEYVRAGIESTTGQWIYAFHHIKQKLWVPPETGQTSA